MYSIINVDPDAPEKLEYVGSKEKFWFTRTDISDDVRWLFKTAREIQPGIWTGEDWAEKVCDELATRLDLPHATYELAEWRSKPGVITRKLDAKDLVLGNEVLAGFAAEYPSDGADHYYRTPLFTVDRMKNILQSDEMPISVDPKWNLPMNVNSALGVFVGYLLLDALVGNTDRHDRNWAITETQSNGDSIRYLAPSFDHASSLGRELTPTIREKRLETRDRGYGVEAYADRARSALYLSESDEKPLLTSEAFRCFAEYDDSAANAWLRRLEEISEADIRIIVRGVPPSRMSDATADFVERLLRYNRCQLLEN